MSWYHEFRYVSVAERKEQAQKKIKALQKEGYEINPIPASGGRGHLAKSFWGKAWCRHLEQFGDFENRLPRGRSYARNGSILHLSIEEMRVEAMVQGSELYELVITIDPLSAGKWKTIKQNCQGNIGSLLELLQGKISEEIMRAMTDPQNGLFPQPREIHFNCNCPDYANMCKHVAAVLYGVALRLDSAPELLFKLRGVDHHELIDTGSSVGSMAKRQGSRRRRTLDSESIGDVFGIELDDGDGEPSSTQPRKRQAPAKKSGSAAKPVRAKKKQAKKAAKKTFTPTAAKVRRLRKQCGLSQSAFARKIGVSPPTINNWEHKSGSLNINPESRRKLAALHRRVNT